MFARKIALLTVVSVLTAPLLVACSSDSGSNGSSEEITLYSGRGEYLVGSLFDQFTEETGITLPEGDYHTLGGFVFHEFGRLPKRGDFITYEDHKFIVHEMEGRRIGALRVVGGQAREVS